MKVKKQHLKKIPASLENIEQWQLSRQNFMKGILLAGAITQIPFLSSCLPKKEEKQTQYKIKQKQTVIIIEIQQILFPIDGNGPSAADINAIGYLHNVISDKRMDPSEIKYIIDGADWVEETAIEDFSMEFMKLAQDQKEKLVKKISKEKWGENWLSVILTFIFEALVCDPLYLGNRNKIGWQWLKHNPGNPRPTKELLYNNILDTVNKRKN